MHESQHCPRPIRPSSAAGCFSLVSVLQMGACRAIDKKLSEAVRQVAAAPRLLLLLGALTHRRCTLQNDLNESQLCDSLQIGTSNAQQLRAGRSIGEVGVQASAKQHLRMRGQQVCPIPLTPEPSSSPGPLAHLGVNLLGAGLESGAGAALRRCSALAVGHDAVVGAGCAGAGAGALRAGARGCGRVRAALPIGQLAAWRCACQA